MFSIPPSEVIFSTVLTHCLPESNFIDLSRKKGPDSDICVLLLFLLFCVCVAARFVVFVYGRLRSGFLSLWLSLK